jgi:hypothetical protein
MSTRVRKHAGAHSARRYTSLRRDVQEAVDRIWPDGIVEMPLDPDKKNFREVYGARACKTIVSLRAKTADILEGFGIAVLPAEEWQKPAPWLRGTEETLIGLDRKAIRVLDAFFFESL